jgi:predicted transcriptional regulator
MKCLSVSQPYADLIISGKKTIELRKWSTKFRGEFFIHAPLKVRGDSCEILGINKSNLRTAVILGKVEIYGVKEYYSQAALEEDYNKHLSTIDFSRHRYGFLLRKPQGLKIPIPCKGKLGFFEAKIIPSRLSDYEIKSDLFDEEYRYQWIGKH